MKHEERVEIESAGIAAFGELAKQARCGTLDAWGVKLLVDIGAQVLLRAAEVAGDDDGDTAARICHASNRASEEGVKLARRKMRGARGRAKAFRRALDPASVPL